MQDAPFSTCCLGAQLTELRRKELFWFHSGIYIMVCIRSVKSNTFKRVMTKYLYALSVCVKLCFCIATCCLLMAHSTKYFAFSLYVASAYRYTMQIAPSLLSKTTALFKSQYDLDLNFKFTITKWCHLHSVWFSIQYVKEQISPVVEIAFYRLSELIAGNSKNMTMIGYYRWSESFIFSITQNYCHMRGCICSL